MSVRFFALIPAIIVATTALMLRAADENTKGAEPALPPPAAKTIDFAGDIQPIFAARCNDCHGEDEQEGQLRLDAKAIVLRGGKSGPLFALGMSEQSLLIRRLMGSGGKRMPLDDEPLSDEQ